MIHELCKKYGISLLVLFGSKARGDSRLSSDADVAYLSDAPLSLMDEARLVGELSAAMQRPVDLVNIALASPLLEYNIFKDGKPLYEKDRGLFEDYLARSLRIYEETKPLFQLKRALL